MISLIPSVRSINCLNDCGVMDMADLNLGGKIYCDIPDSLASKIIDEIRSAEKLDRHELERKCQELKQKIVSKRGKTV